MLQREGGLLKRWIPVGVGRALVCDRCAAGCLVLEQKWLLACLSPEVPFSLLSVQNPDGYYLVLT